MSGDSLLSPFSQRQVSERYSAKKAPEGGHNTPEQIWQHLHSCPLQRNLNFTLQVGPGVDERELIQAFERHGTVVGYKLLRGSMCGFIDFERVEEAASARSALHEANFADCDIRVEYKVLL